MSQTISSLLLICLTIIFVTVDSFACPTNVTCFDKETCCQTTAGLWACCPIEDGTCCDDGLHCCPKGDTCLPNGNCSSSSLVNQDRSLPLRFKQIQCQDGTVCPDGNTCCQLASGQYGCCPIVDAVCCSDHLHCCPNGYQCDGEHGRCKKKHVIVNEISCPDGSVCPDGETCCLLESGDYGCCPLSDAVCCSDHLHCCPHGYQCDVEKSQCIREISIPWLTKRASIPAQYRNMTKLRSNNEESPLVPLNIPSNVATEMICPDAISLCPSTSTCCITAESTWGCCPAQDAVCCSDHQHCCPRQYKCDLHIFKCDHPLLGSIPLLKKRKSLNTVPLRLIEKKLERSSVSTIICPDGKSQCPEDATCCQLADGSYGCCPYLQATCCSDKVHCCPNGYSCDQAGQRCTRHLTLSNLTETRLSARKLPPLHKKIKQKFVALKSGNEQQLCPDGITQCSLMSTCCPNGNSKPTTYSCCPYAKGVCCGTNGSICCPNNYACDAQQLSCQLQESKSLRSLSLTMDYHQCGTSNVACSYDQTCCRTYGSADGEFACCGFPNAQCCEDGRHCCPSDSVCDVRSGGCVPKY